MTKLEFPEVDTYFIAWNNNRTEIQAYDLVLITQVMGTPWIEVDYYINEQEYKDVLVKNKIETFSDILL